MLLISPFPHEARLTLERWRSLLGPFSGGNSSVRYFKLLYRDFQNISQETWRAGLACFPRLEELLVGHTPTVRTVETVLNATNLAPLIAVLGGERKQIGAGTGPGGIVETSTTVCAPCLRRMTWDSVNVDQEIVDALVRMIEARGAQGVPLQQVVLQDAFLTRDEEPDRIERRLEGFTEVTIQ